MTLICQYALFTTTRIVKRTEMLKTRHLWVAFMSILNICTAGIVKRNNYIVANITSVCTVELQNYKKIKGFI